MPTVAPEDEPGVRQLKQVTVRSDDEVEAVNQLLADGWRLVSIGHRSDATIYVLGREEKRQKPRTGFLHPE
ncbi:MAG: hypothetical protein N2204_02255 [Anaerolineae bacterium]|nr:hypothetical protein [Anaerolineae bacterium]